jgi:hypothetical protein
MSKGFAQPLLIITIVAVLGLSFALLYTRGDFSKDVKGTSTASADTKPGFSVSIVSTGGMWELSKVLCLTEDECSNNFSGGKKIGSIGGGETDSHTLSIQYSPDWKDYKFMKIFVKPSWNSSTRNFNVKSLGDITGSVKKTFSEGDALIFPVEEISSNFKVSATFSDN